VAPSHVSHQNLICLLSCMLKFPILRNYSLTFIKPLQNWESPDFLITCVIALDPKYLFFISCFYAPSELIKLKSHLLRRHLFCSSWFSTPSPPWSFGLQIIPYFASLYFFLWLSPCQKIWIYKSSAYAVSLLILHKRIT
jgi:hypothetical protein